MHGHIRARPGVGGRGQVVGVGLAGTLNTVTVSNSGTGSRLENHSPSAHDFMTASALALPALAFEKRFHECGWVCGEENNEKNEWNRQGVRNIER